MKKLAVIFMILTQILFASNLPEPDLEIFFDENATSKQTDSGLEQILDFLRQNPHRVNDELGECCDRLFVLFIFNTGKIDSVRIEKSTQI